MPIYAYVTCSMLHPQVPLFIYRRKTTVVAAATTTSSAVVSPVYLIESLEANAAELSLLEFRLVDSVYI
jgi:hypothetical protein